MRAKTALSSFPVPRSLGRSEGDMTAKGHGEQLDLFREVLTRTAKIQVMAMMALSDPKALEKMTAARIADIAVAMGYEQKERADGKAAFDIDLYRRIEEVGMRLRRREVEMFVREYEGTVRDGRKPGATRRKYREGLVSMTVLQEFGFYYEDEEGNPLNLAAMAPGDQDQLIDVQPKPKKRKKDQAIAPVDQLGVEPDQLLKYEAPDGKYPIWAIPMTDDHGRIIRNADGEPRRRPANGVWWRWSTRFAELTRDKETSWLVWLGAVNVLRKYLKKPVTFNLIWHSLFHKGGMIEIGHDKLVEHLGIEGTRNRTRVEKAIDGAFEDMMAEGIIDRLPTVRDAGYYKPTEKTNRPRRYGKVYQWRVAKQWSTGPGIIDVDQLEATDEAKKNP